MNSKKAKNQTCQREGYSTEKDYYNKIAPSAEDRAKEIEAELVAAFKDHITPYQSKLIDISTLTYEELGKILFENPKTIKPLCTLVGVASRSMYRDTSLGCVDTYNPQLNNQESQELARYLLEILPKSFLLELLVGLDRIEYIDKEKRALKGAWEIKIRETLNNLTGLNFIKKRIRVDNKPYEIDAAYFEGTYLKYAVDIKRIEAKQDFQKRSDEIISKSMKYKTKYPNGKFGAVIYYPFEQNDVRSRLKYENIDSIVFANECPESIAKAVKDLIRDLQIQPASLQSHIS